MDTATTVYSSFFCCMTWLSIQVQWTEYVPGRKAWNISWFIVSSHASSVSVAALLDAGCIDSEICTANLRPHFCCSNQLRLYKSTEWFQHVILLHWKCLSRLHHTKWKLDMVLCTKTHLRSLAISCYPVNIADRFSDFPPNLSSIVRVPDWRDENLRFGWSTWSWPLLVCKSFISANELSLPAWAEIDSLNQNLKISHTCHIGSLDLCT